jgi:hypothetical protein
MRGDVYLDGPRVSAPAVGGDRFFAMLASDLGDGADDGGWGRACTARSEKEREPRSIFVPPRPMTEAHFEALRLALVDARGGSFAALARFHWCFVRLHPFHCCNQSLAMNLVNAVLGDRAIPHLALDHLALRLGGDAYAEAFIRAVAAFAVTETSAARRLEALRDRWRRALALMDRVSAAKSDDQAQAIVAADPEAARWALLGAHG